MALRAYAGVVTLDFIQTTVSNVITTGADTIDYPDAIAMLQIYAGIYQG